MSKTVNTGITLVDVRNEAMDTIKRIKDGSINLDEAKVVRSLLDTVINTAKTQVDFMNAIPKHIKDEMTKDTVLSIAGTLRDRDAEMDETMEEIEKKKNETYHISK